MQAPLTFYVTAKARHYLPTKAHQSDAGFDVCACLPDGPIELHRGNTVLIPCGFSLGLEPGYEAQFRPRSGLALKHGITILNSPGTIDAGYRGEIAAIVHRVLDASSANTPEGHAEPFIVRDGDRIGQIVIQPVLNCQLQMVDKLDETDRGANGFGSTGQ